MYFEAFLSIQESFCQMSEQFNSGCKTMYAVSLDMHVCVQVCTCMCTSVCTHVSLWLALCEMLWESGLHCLVSEFWALYLLLLDSGCVGGAVAGLDQWKISRTQTMPCNVVSYDTFTIVFNTNEKLEKGERFHS